MSKDDGATPQASAKMECPGDGSGRMHPHYPHWVWTVDAEGRRMLTDRVKCSSCNLEWTPERLKDVQQKRGSSFEPLPAERFWTFRYTNHRGETKQYTVLPRDFWFGRSPYHPDEDQWIVTALDVDRNVVRDFALLQIRQGQGQ